MARRTLAGDATFAPFAQPAIVNGAAGLVIAPHGRPIGVVGFSVAGGRIVEIDLVLDPDKLRALTVAR